MSHPYTFSISNKTGSSINGIHMYIPSTEQIRKLSVVEVTTSGINKDGRPLRHGINSTLMGTCDARLNCGTCGEGIHGECPGHYGHLEFPMDLYHVGLKDLVYRVLRVTCYFCSCLLFDETDPKVQRIVARYPHATKRTQRFLELTPTSRHIRSCFRCGMHQPKYEQPSAFKITATWEKDFVKEHENDPKYTIEGHCIFYRPFQASDAKSILRNMSQNAKTLLGFDAADTPPENFVCSNLIIPPPCIRPSIQSDTMKSCGQNDMTQRLRDIIRRVEEFWFIYHKRRKHGLSIPWYLFSEEQMMNLHSQTGWTDGREVDDEDDLDDDLEEDLEDLVLPSASASAGTAGTDWPSPSSHTKKRAGEPLAKTGRATKAQQRIDEIVARARAQDQEDAKEEGGAAGRGKKKANSDPLKGLTDKEKALEKRGQRDPKLTLNLLAAANLLQEELAIYFKSDVRGASVGNPRDRPRRSIRERLKGKQGRIRQTLMGKRVNFCARSPVAPDPNLDADEVGVPQQIALVMTYPEKVTAMNIQKLQERVRVGFGRPDGCSAVMKQDEGGHTMIPLEFFKGDTRLIVLKPGDTVERYLEENEAQLFNRHPSLHKHSMMCHRSKIHNFKTFTFNPVVTSAYNADYDGDEMNTHLPQNEVAKTEAITLLGVNKNMLTPKTNSPMVGLIQDGVVMTFLMTQRGTFFTEDEFHEFISKVRHQIEPHQRRNRLPVPAILKPTPLWTGKQIFSWLLPRNLMFKRCVRGAEPDGQEGFSDMEERTVLIVRGELLCGALCSQVMGRASGGLMHVFSLDYGMDRHCKFVSDAQRVALQYIPKRGFSIGMQDCVPHPGVLKELQMVLRRIHDCVLDLHAMPGIQRADPARIEAHETYLLNQGLNWVTRRIKNMATALRANSVFNMVSSGAKGSLLTMAQIMYLVGQQQLHGQRLGVSAVGSTRNQIKRLLPSFPLDDYTQPDAHGFVDRGYCKGLSPVQVFLCAICGRDSLIDVATRTSQIGYMQRTTRSGAETKVVRGDGTVRDSSNRIVQFAYNADAMDGTYLERQTLHVLGYSDKKLMAKLFPTPPTALLSLHPMATWEHAQQAHLAAYVRAQDALRAHRESGNLLAFDFKFPLPVNVARLLHRYAYEPRHKEKPLADPASILGYLEKLFDQVTRSANKYTSFVALQASLLSECTAHILVGTYRMTQEQVERFFDECTRRVLRCMVAAGEAVGFLASECIGEPSTQMTLNSFHFAGVGTKNVTLGLPRLRECFRCTQDIKTPMMTLLFAEPYCNDPQFLLKRVHELRGVRLCNVVSYATLDLVAETQDVWSEGQAQALRGLALPEAKPEAMIKLWLSRDKMLNVDLSLADVIRVVDVAFPQNTLVVVDQVTEKKTVLCVHLQSFKEACKAFNITTKQMEAGNARRQILTKLTEHIVIRGIPAITDAYVVQKVVALSNGEGDAGHKKMWVIETAGSDLEAVMAMQVEGLDKRLLFSNHLHQTWQTFGIDAAVALLNREIQMVLSFDGTYVDPRHVALLVDSMCFTGRPVPMSRYGIQQTEPSPLLLASFEKTVEVILKACAHGVVDAVNGVSENIMLGRVAPVGTGTVDVRVDHRQFIQNWYPDAVNRNTAFTPRGLVVTGEEYTDRSMTLQKAQILDFLKTFAHHEDNVQKVEEYDPEQPGLMPPENLMDIDPEIPPAFHNFESLFKPSEVPSWIL